MTTSTQQAGWIAVALFAAVFAVAQSPAPDALPEPDVRLVYESDTRAYYRPCG
jgi:hypothetical protein